MAKSPLAADSICQPCACSDSYGQRIDGIDVYTAVGFNLPLVNGENFGHAQIDAVGHGGSCANGTSASPTAVNLITNADQGLLASWEVLTNVTSGGSTSKSYYIANTSGGGAASQNTTTSLLTPVLQARDGTFFGTDGNGNMVRFDQTGNIMWSVGGSPQIATADGGVLGISGTTYDSNGHATGQTSLPIQSMTG